MKTSKAVYDSRFFVESFYSNDDSTLRRIRQHKVLERYISAVVLHEVYRLALSREGREVAKIKVANIKKSFKVADVDDEIAQLSAEFRHQYQLPMGDSMIAATASLLSAVCVTDDPHFKQIKEIQTQWI